MFSIKNLYVDVDAKPILQDLSLDIKPGEIHAIMGPNGSGKSTLANAIAGHPKYKILRGEIFFNGEKITDAKPFKRAQKGIFTSFQHPQAIPGVSVFDFIKTAVNSLRKFNKKTQINPMDFRKLLRKELEKAGLDSNFMYRALNDGFSGGEKKKLEIAQMAMLCPRFAILDEIDSGLDIDALKIVAKGINRFAGSRRSVLLITHYQRILKYVKPNFIHIMVCGKIVKSGNGRMAQRLEREGYRNFKNAVAKPSI